MNQLNGDALTALRKHAEHIRDSSSIVADGFVGQITPPVFMQVNARAMLALLDALHDATQDLDRLRATIDKDTDVIARQHNEANALLDRIEALEAKWERPSHWRCDGCGATATPSNGREPDAHGSCGGVWVRFG